MKHTKEPLDMYEMDMMPKEMKAYLRNYGYSFSRAACEWAISLLRKENPSTKKEEKIETWDKQKVDELLKKHNVTLENNVGYNYVYICNMLLADKYKSSIPDEAHLALGIKDCIDDVDASPRLIFKQWVTHMDDSGIVIDWGEIM